ncbi:sigma-54-dependent Fis family transcriptional regulator [Desulfopila sp. IMCC35008]|uniref:sigma-54 interaction domain-containing protein n=1 Tax=Desulfopila sp. IMCC35008 TaxID=2653858 RepID=UPI0013D82C20|nr:sigma 54-interacting transcriptional regulator [Desulfopila sp. IMCC35008]
MNQIFDEYFCNNWKSVIDIMTEGLMIVDNDGIILFANHAMEKLLQYSVGELVGSHCSLLECTTCDSSRRLASEKHCFLFEDGRVSGRRCAFKRKDGSWVQVLKNATALTNDKGEFVIGVENLTDITEVLDKEEEIYSLKKQLVLEDSFYGLVGATTPMRQMYQLIQSAAASDAPVTIYGESGTGKELVAGALHRLSNREPFPFIKVNCAALNENLLESELFGHVKGAFTGAERLRTGRFEAAQKGSIFLDEIADVPLAIQAKLLRVIQEKEIERVGDHATIPIDVRIITASHKNLEVQKDLDLFREDLYYRINVIPIHIPPLRDRKGDIPLICSHVGDRLRRKSGKQIDGVSRSSMDLLLEHDWPGNVRELINVMEYAFVICHGDEILPDHLPGNLLQGGDRGKTTRSMNFSSISGASDAVRIREALKRTGGNRTKAAEILGVSRVTLWKWMKKMGLDGRGIT